MTLETEVDKIDDNDPESGSKLRQLLQKEIASRRKAEDELTTYKVKDVLSVEGFDLVKPEDLEGVSVDKVEERARALQEERETVREAVLRDFLERQGIEGDALEDMVKEYAARSDAPNVEARETLGRARQVGKLDSNPVSSVNVRDLHGVDALTAAFEADAKRAVKR